MILFPDDILHTLEYSRIQELTAERCAGEPGRQQALSLRPSGDVRFIKSRLAEVDEWHRTLMGPAPVPFGTYEDIRPTFRYLEIQDYILDAEDLLRYRTILQLLDGLRHWFDDEQCRVYPVLGALVSQLPWDPAPLQAINQVFDDKGDVRDDASPALLQIRRAIRRLESELEKVFQQLVQQYRKSGLLSDASESVRNGRRVLIVPVEHKRKIRGIIHDESTTGRTVFLEPEQMVELNNDLFELESEERQELTRIFKELCQSLRPWLGHFRDIMRGIIRLDLIRAKAMVSQLYRGTCPEIEEKLEIRLRQAYHPLLRIKFNETGRTVVPYDLELHRQQRILVLSGPNAGGKSVTMKSLMLIQMMVQSGFLAPAASGSRLPVYHRFFADIGDQQSLEDDLSTYSSRLRNLRFFLEQSDRRTLIALDEFGSGTDPKMGGAIAEALLHHLHRKQVMGIVTTHYSNLKIFAFKQPGMVNGAMVFDQEKLKPAYALMVGKPGSSYAFEIAASSGLSEEVLEYARVRMGDDSQAVEKLLGNLQQERRELLSQLQQGQEKEKRLDQLIKNYESLFRDLEYQRKKHKLEVRELALQQKARESMGVEEVLRDIREERRLEVLQERKERLKAEQERLRAEVVQIRDQAEALEIGPVNRPEGPLTVGDFVRIRGGGAVGEVLEIQKGRARLGVGELTMLVDVKDLEWVNEPLNRQRSQRAHLDGNEHVSPSGKLDIRGFKKEEALRVLELFIDKALLGSASRVHILHGKGTGALRKLVIEKAREYKDIRAVEPANPEDGGEGVTVLRFG